MSVTQRLRLAGVVLAAFGLLAARAPAALEGVPRFAHVVVIVEENKDYDQILGGEAAPFLARMARTYGDADMFYGEVHPSEANYVALLGGDTFGIHDDDAWYCKAALADPACPNAALPGYVDHTVRGPHLGDQLSAAHLTWRGYYENLPAPGSLAYIAGDPKFDSPPHVAALYASKHAGFVNFATVQAATDRADRLVGFDRLDADITAGTLPSFALIVPNQCNEMHGLYGPKIPEDCLGSNKAGLIRRGDEEARRLIERLQATPAWKGPQNFAIIVTFDEGAGGVRAGCCSVTPDAPSNYGGGHIPTIVITNHGPRGLKDDTPYNHYSLLRTIEDAFGIGDHLGRAADSAHGVKPMVKLFGG